MKLLNYKFYNFIDDVRHRAIVRIILFVILWVYLIYIIPCFSQIKIS